MVGSRRSHRVPGVARQDGTGSTSSGETSRTSTSTTTSSTTESSTSQPPSTTPPDTATSTSTSSEPTSEPPSSTTSTITSTSVPPDTTSTISTHTTERSTITEPTSTPPADPQPTSLPPPAEPLPSTTSTSSMTTVTSTLSNGQTTVFTSALPTSLSSATPSKSNQNRTAIIAGTTTAGIVLILIALGAVFLYRRHQIRQQFDAYFHRPKRENRGLLDGEEFDDDDGDLVPMQRYRDASGSTTSEAPRSTTPNSQAPSLYRARALESGSIFREEVWPPPGKESQLVDPFENNVRRSREVDLGSIVDNVMGPKVVAVAAEAGHTPRSENPSTGTGSSSGTAYTGLPVTQERPGSSQSAYKDPFRSASQSTEPSSSVYYTLPPGASPALTPGMPTSTMENPTLVSHQLQPPPGTHTKPASSLLEPGTSATKPRTSSPLARVMSSASSKLSVGAAESKLWLDRKVRGSTETPRT